MNKKKEKQAGSLKGSWDTASLKTGTKYCFKCASNIDCRTCLFSTWWMSVNGEVSVSVITKLNTLTRSFVHAVVQDTDVSWLCPLWQVQNRTLALQLCWGRVPDIAQVWGRFLRKMSSFFAYHTTACQCCSQSQEFWTAVLPSTN